MTVIITFGRLNFMSRNNRGAINAVDLNGNILRVRENNLLFQRSTPRFTGPFNPYLYGLIVSDNFLNHKINYPGTISYPALFTKTLSLTDTSMFESIMHLRNPPYNNFIFGVTLLPLL